MPSIFFLFSLLASVRQFDLAVFAVTVHAQSLVLDKLQNGEERRHALRGVVFAAEQLF